MVKRRIKIIALVLVFVLMSGGCGKSSASKSTLTDKNNTSTGKPKTQKNEKEDKKTDYDNIIDINEKVYVTYINEIYVNTDDYVGKTIRIEGMYKEEEYEPTKQMYSYVYRVGPGCCGNDGSMCGFEFTYDKTMPKNNDWIEVVGVLETYEEDGYTYITLKADSVTVKEERGAETVEQ